MNVLIILGSKLTSRSVHDELMSRLDSALEIGVEDQLFIVSGGTTNMLIDISEADAMENYLVSKGIPNTIIIKENKSTDTIENGYYSRLIVDKLTSVDNIYVVSSCYHMPRVRFIFENCFGANYKFNFSHCSGFNRIQTNEIEGMIRAKKFFDGIVPGDEKVIGKRLATGYSEI